MKNTFTYFAMVAVMALACLDGRAQSDFNRWEIAGGYQFNSVSTGLGELNDAIGQPIFENRVGAHGVNLSVTGNVTRLIGIKFDYSSSNKNPLAEIPGEFVLRYRNQQFLGGVQIKNNDKDGPTFKPWAHVLAGLANQKIRCEGFCEFPSNLPLPVPTAPFTETNNSFGMAFGGGLDIKVHERIDIRAIQFDYNPIFYGGSQRLGLSDLTQNNVRIGFGVVFH